MTRPPTRPAARTVRRSLAAAAVTVLAGLAAACGSGGTAAPTSSAAPTTTAPTTTVSTTTTVPRLDAEQLLDLARRSVVRVRNTGCGELSTATAWLAGDGRMVSNRHVVEGERFLEMATWDGRDLAPRSAQVADAADVSRIDGDWAAGRGLRPLPIRAGRVAPGERIAIVGYPEGNELQVVTGVAVDYVTDARLAPREVLRLTTVVRPGNSGGPAMDEQGRVVGVVYAKETATSNSLVIPITDVFGPRAAPLRSQPTCS